MIEDAVPTHVAFAAPDRATVDAFHSAAVGAGARTMVRPAFGRSCTRITTQLSFTTLPVTTSKRSAIYPPDPAPCRETARPSPAPEPLRRGRARARRDSLHGGRHSIRGFADAALPAGANPVRERGLIR